MRALQSRLFSGFSKDLGVKHSALIFYSELRWLSWWKCLQTCLHINGRNSNFLQRRKTRGSREVSKPLICNEIKVRNLFQNIPDEF